MSREIRSDNGLDLETHLFYEIWRNTPDNMFILRVSEDDFYIVKTNLAQQISVELVSALPRDLPMRQMMPADLYEAVVANYKRCIERKEPIQYEESEELTSHDGSTQYWSTTLSPIFGSSGDVQYIFGISRNITRLKQAQKAAEAANEVKTSFLANMSHEMRTPLNGIRGATELLLKCVDPQEKEELCRLILNATEALTRQTSDILEYARIDSGNIRLENAPFSLRQAVHDVQNLIRHAVQEKNIRFSVNIDSRIPDQLHGDGGRLKQILLNLVSNAVKFTHEGSVSLSVDLDKRLGHEYKLRFRVVDTGIGIHADDMDKLFRPFSQVDQSTTRRYEGSGLGLTICKDLVNAKGGSIDVSSVPGKGSVFEFNLSYPALMQNLPVPGPIDPLPKIPDLHVLLVEDNRTNQLVTKKILAHAGIRSTVAEHGQQALDLCQQQRFDLILMDWHMPVMDGLRATQLLRTLDDYHRCVPIVGLTANAMEQDRQTCLNAGMDDVVLKPLSGEKLLRCIARLHTGREAPAVQNAP
ncbi:MAG: ATP-binding protein [Saccharospirillaceae bacterium]|nr:ATP-binding protein [Saccharospirillaceae bacterium]MCD8533158.1 ATP-binding protein [Saccharospirillaceae bacterium]